MTRQQFSIALIVLAVSGFLGGALSGQVFGPTPVMAADEPAAPQDGVISARGFHLVDDEGLTLGRFELDGWGQPSLTLVNRVSRTKAAELGVYGQRGQLRFHSDKLENLLKIGLEGSPYGYYPSLMMRDRNLAARIEMGVQFKRSPYVNEKDDSPYLTMFDRGEEAMIDLAVGDHGKLSTIMLGNEKSGVSTLTGGNETVLRVGQGPGCYLGVLDEIARMGLNQSQWDEKGNAEIVLDEDGNAKLVLRDAKGGITHRQPPPR